MPPQKKLIILFFILALFTRVDSQPIFPPPQPSITSIFAYYKVTVQWPKSVCDASPCTSIASNLPPMFTIHGLWPSFQNGRPVYPQPPNSPNPCTNVSSSTPSFITANDISSIRSHMDQYWPNLLVGNSDLGFWNHEWSRHGRCSDLPQLPEQYFKLTLALYSFYNASLILDSAGIFPGGYTTPHLVRQAYFGVIGVYVQVACINTQRGQVLSEISVCIDKQYAPISCTGNPFRGACINQPTSPIYFP